MGASSPRVTTPKLVVLQKHEIHAADTNASKRSSALHRGIDIKIQKTKHAHSKNDNSISMFGLCNFVLHNFSRSSHLQRKMRWTKRNKKYWPVNAQIQNDQQECPNTGPLKKESGTIVIVRPQNFTSKFFFTEICSSLKSTYLAVKPPKQIKVLFWQQNQWHGLSHAEKLRKLSAHAACQGGTQTNIQPTHVQHGTNQTVT